MSSGSYHPTALVAMREALPLIEQGKISEAIDVVEPFQPQYIIDCFYVPEDIERFPDDETIENHRQFLIQWIDRMIAKGDGISGGALDGLSYLESEYATSLSYFDDKEWYSRDAYLQNAAIAQRYLRSILDGAERLRFLPGESASESTVERFRAYGRQVAEFDLLPTDAEDAERDPTCSDDHGPRAVDKRGPWEVELRKLAERGEVLDEHGYPVYTVE